MTPPPPKTIECRSETANAVPVVIQVREHSFRSDLSPSSGSIDSAPGPHDYFDASLAACKALTAVWYARKKQIPLERVESSVERDDSAEREGKYVLRVRLDFHGPLSREDRTRLYNAVAACPIHKLMTTTEVVIETAPLEERAQA